MNIKIIPSIFLLCGLAACAGQVSDENISAISGPASPVPATPVLATPATEQMMISQLADVDGRQLEYWAHHAPGAQATLVFENGLMLPLTTWQRVTSAFTLNTNMLAYNRPGVGRSTESELSSDPMQTVEQLRKLLQAQQFSPPYVLVGHSLGGQYVQLFAERFPEQVRAIVLVDALPIGIVKPLEDFPWYTRWGLSLFAPSYVKREVESIYPMGETVLAAADRFDKPMIRLVALIDPPPPPPQGLIRDLLNGVLYAEDFGVWSIDPDEGERRMDELYPQSVVRHVPAVHRIQEATPEAVIASIQELMKQN